MSEQLNDGQAQLIDKMITWFNDWESGHRIANHPQWFAYSGAAGTGKTFSVKEFINRLGLAPDEYICCAYVGKAVLNLQKHDLPACTIHSLIYNTIVEKVIDDDDGGYGPIKYKLRMIFALKEHLPENLRLIICDEATMVNNDFRDKMLSFGLPIIFIGDMNQLPPIFGISEVMMYPDHILTQIMRTAEDDPIVQLSQMVLNDIPIEVGQYGLSRVVESHPIDNSLLDDFDIIICGKNATRDRLNQTIMHDLLHRKDNVPFLGAKVINRQNNWDIAVDGISLTNGLIGEITNVIKSTAYKGYYTIDFRPDFMDSDFEDLKVDRQYILADYNTRKDFGISKYEKFEYAYAITCHLSQGSEWNRVLFIDEPFWDREMTQKLRYTAITRAAVMIEIVQSQRPRNHWDEYNLARARYN